MFELPEYSLIAAVLPILWAIYLRHTSGTGIQIRFVNLNYRAFICIRNGSDTTVFIDDLVCYKSHRHKYNIHSADERGTIILAPGEEKRICFDSAHFVEFVEKLNISKKETFMLSIKLNTSRGVLTTGWIKLLKKEDSQYGYVFKNSPRAIVVRTDMNPTYSEYINPLLAAFIVCSLFGAFILSYEVMANIVVVDLLMILFFGPFTFIKGFKNGTVGSLICMGLGFLLGIMLAIPTKDISFLLLGAFFFIVIYLDAMICSGGLTLDSE